MKRQRIGVITLGMLSLIFAICATIINDQTLTLSYISLIVAFISIFLSLKEYPNYTKDFEDIKQKLKSLQEQCNKAQEQRTERKDNGQS